MRIRNALCYMDVISLAKLSKIFGVSCVGIYRAWVYFVPENSGCEFTTKSQGSKGSTIVKFDKCVYWYQYGFRCNNYCIIAVCFPEASQKAEIDSKTVKTNEFYNSERISRSELLSTVLPASNLDISLARMSWFWTGLKWICTIYQSLTPITSPLYSIVWK